MYIFIKKRTIFFLCLLGYFLTAEKAFSQNNYEFLGALKLNGNEKSVITYRLVFEELNGKLKGYSITDLAGKHETKNLIEGSYNKKLKLFEFRETNIVYTKSKFEQSAFCFVNFSGKLKLVQSTSKLEGAFKGLYKNKQKCIDGTLVLIGSTKLYNLVNKVNNRIQKSNKVDVKTKENINPLKVLDSLKTNRLSNDENLNVFWGSNKFKMEIYDIGKEDGDVVNIYQNNKLILAKHKLTNAKRIIEVILDGTKNEFKIEAINEGTIAPNTAKITLFDGDTSFDLMSNLKKGEKASITIHKK